MFQIPYDVTPLISKQPHLVDFIIPIFLVRKMRFM